MKISRMIIMASNTFCWQTVDELLITLERMSESGNLYPSDDPTFNEVSKCSLLITLKRFVNKRILLIRPIKNCRLSGERCQPNKHEYILNPNYKGAR